MTWGPRLATLLEFSKVSGKVPKALEDRPELLKRCELYYTAFDSLSRSRQAGMGGALPLTMVDIKAYLDLIGEASTEERLTYLRRIQVLDQAYLKIAHKDTPGTDK